MSCLGFRVAVFFLPLPPTLGAFVKSSKAGLGLFIKDVQTDSLACCLLRCAGDTALQQKAKTK